MSSLPHLLDRIFDGDLIGRIEFGFNLADFACSGPRHCENDFILDVTTPTWQQSSSARTLSTTGEELGITATL